MVTTFSIVVLALLLTGVATATVYAVPAISQVTSAQTQAGDGVQTQDHLQLQTRARNGEQAQTCLHLRDGLQNGNGTCDGSGASMEGALGQAEGEMYQNQYCEQTHVRAQHRNGLDLESDAME